jgi:hypothetical protein
MATVQGKFTGYGVTEETFFVKENGVAEAAVMDKEIPKPVGG